MPKNLLLADDSITIQKVVGITFAGEDFTIVAVDNGDDAVRKAKELRPDIVLADVVMPKKNGYEVCEAIKSDPALATVPVLLLAGTFEAFDEARARNARADGHIAKPFESQALINKVRELLDRGAGGVEHRDSAPMDAGPTTQPGAASPAVSRPTVPSSTDVSSRPSYPMPSSVPPAPPVAPPVPALSGSPGWMSQTTASQPAGSAPSLGARLPASSPSALPPTARSAPPVLSRAAPPPLAANPPTLEKRPEVPLVAAPAQGGAVGELDWAALGFETDAAAGTTPPRPSSPAVTRQVSAPSSTLPGAAPVGFAREVVPGVPVRAPAPATPGTSGASSMSTTIPSRQTGAASVVQSGLPEATSARFAGLTPGQEGPSRYEHLTRPSLPDRHVRPSTTSSAPARPVDRAAPPKVSTSQEMVALGEPIDLADLEIEEPGSSEEVRVKPQPAPATVLPDDGGEALLRDALSRASREVIERIAWEVIPTLAETIIREHVERLVNEREK